MNLQRYISTVYSELIPDKYYKVIANDKKDDKKTIKDNINVELQKLDPDITFSDMRTKYTIKYDKYKAKVPNAGKTKENEKIIEARTSLLDTLFFEILFGNTLEALYQKTSNTVFLFPIFFDINDSSRRFTDSLSPIYQEVLKHRKETQEFNREFGLKKKVETPKSEADTSDNSNPDGNMVLFVPVFSDEEDETKEFTDRVNSYFDRAFTYINEVRQKKISEVSGARLPNKFDSIVYTIDKDSRFFTGYYKKKLPEEKSKILNGIVEKFVEKLGCRIAPVKDPILKLTRDEIRKKIIADGKVDDDLMKENMYQLVDKFNDIYKKTNDKEYLKLASSTDNQTKLRIYYRVNNTDIVDSFTEIKPGSSYVYKLQDDKKCSVGYFKERKGATNQYVFRAYKGLEKKACPSQPIKQGGGKEKIPQGNTVKDEKEEFEEAEDKDFKDDGQNETTEFIIETKTFGSVIKYKKVEKDNYSTYYPGVVELYMDLHIYEKYKWFQFNEIDGTLTPETNIKIYKNILFDKKSLIDFLKEKKLYTDKSRLALEFLKINQSNTLLLEYVDYIMTNKKSTNVYEETLFSGKLRYFVEKNKKSILEILFQSNELIYMNPQRTSQTKENIKQNYKIVNQTQFPILDNSDIVNHFKKIIYEDEESKYCKKSKCELTPDMFDEAPSKNLEYAVVIIDVTKDNVEVASDLKAKANCKKLRRTLRKQLQPFLQILMPRFGGRTRKRKILRTRRRKNRH